MPGVTVGYAIPSARVEPRPLNNISCGLGIHALPYDLPVRVLLRCASSAPQKNILSTDPTKIAPESYGAY